MQAVLQGHGLGEGHQLVEHGGASGQFFVALAFLVEQSDGFGVAALRVGKFASVPVDAAQTEQEHALLHPIARALGASALVGGNGCCGVGHGQVDVSHSIVHLVKIVLVVLRARHALQLFEHPLLSALLGGQHLGLENARVEGEVEGRTFLQTLLQCAVCLLGVLPLLLHLRQEVVEASLPAVALGVARGAFEVGHGLVKALLCEEEVGGGGIGEPAHAAAHAVAAQAAQRVLGIVVPARAGVAPREPLAGLGGHGGFGGVEARDVGKGGCGLEKFAFLKLRLAHEEPGVLEEGVVLLALQVGACLGGALFALGVEGLLLYGVQGNGFLAFGDGRLEVGLARFARLLVGHEEHGELVGVVVLVGFELGFFTFDESLLAVVEGVVAGGEGVPASCPRSVLAGGTGGGEQRQEQQCREGPYRIA